MAAAVIPAKYGIKSELSKVSPLIASNIFNNEPAIIVGIDSKNEYWTDNFLLKPHIIPAVIVEPDLDKPGITAKAWVIPIIMACYMVIFSSEVFPSTVLSQRKRRIEVINNAMPVVIREE